MSEDDDVSKMLRELRESAEHRRFHESLENGLMRSLSPFHGTWLRPSTVKRRAQPNPVRHMICGEQPRVESRAALS